VSVLNNVEQAARAAERRPAGMLTENRT